MKKILSIISFMILISCTTAIENTHNHNHEGEEIHNELVEQIENKDKANLYILNLHNAKEETEHTHLLVVISKDKKDAFIRKDSEEYLLERVEENKYSNEKGDIVLQIGNEDIILNYMGRKIKYMDTGKKSLNYAKVKILDHDDFDFKNGGHEHNHNH